MALFSQRKGIQPLRKILQVDSIDVDLHNSLWNALDFCLWQRIETNSYSSRYNKQQFEDLFNVFWISFFKVPVDQKPKRLDNCISTLRDYFFECEWYKVYDFIEFTMQNCPEKLCNTLKKSLNHFLETENSVYRIVDNQVVEITSEVEIKEIEEALQTPLVAVRSHLQTSLSHLSSREKPDYRNSVKESISAVEALARALCKKPKATLGQLIKRLESHAGIHPALKNAFDKLYGYASDEGGVRHSLLEQDVITKSEATFMLTACSAFVNYVVSKAAEKGIKIKPTR